MTEHYPSADSGPSSDELPVQTDWTEAGTPIYGVVEAIAEVTDCAPREVESLHGYVDVDALNALLTAGRERDSHVSVSFTYDGFEVSVHGSGAVTVRSGTDAGKD